jgi:hypothetical protein
LSKTRKARISHLGIVHIHAFPLEGSVIIFAYSEFPLNMTLGKKKKKAKTSQAPVAHTYKPNYSGGRDQEDCSSNPV